ncbi:MAG: FkbM family methyltransferase, partial [Kovacikia sp.]
MSLERINQNPRFTLEMVETKALANHPLRVIDVGARGGQEFHWHLYADQVKLIGFEPDLEECERLNQQASKNAAFFPIALSHEKGKRRFYQYQWAASSSFYPFEPTMLQRLPNEAVLHVVGESELETIDLDSFLDENKIEAIDFIKLDVEG